MPNSNILSSCRSARLPDLGPLMDLENSSFPGDRMSRRQMRYHIANPLARIWVCTDEHDIPQAYLLAFFHKGRTPRVYSVAVAAQARGQGIGELLMERFLKEAKKMRADSVMLEVRTDSKAAIKLYEKLGFLRSRSLPGYYEDGCDGIKMTKKL